MANNSKSMVSRALENEAAPGIGLLIFASLALLVANSPLSSVYQQVLGAKVALPIGIYTFDKPVLLWINDGLMAVFFLMVGIELKRELVFGHLKSASQVVLPGMAALGGMLIPAAVYLFFNYQNPVAANGWAIPAATDIAFALAVFALFAKGLPSEVKVFLLTIAIIDDLGAIAIIAAFYTADLSLMALATAAVLVAVLFGLNRVVPNRTWPFLLVGLLLWLATLKSGVHATLAGVIVGLLLPLGTEGHREQSPGIKVEHAIQPWVAFLVLPVFAFANAGIDFRAVLLADLFSPVVLGITFGLLIGKPVGIAGAIWITEKLGLAKRSAALSWDVVLAVGFACGIGFTMSLFIGSLAFEHTAAMGIGDERIGIVAGSLLSAVLAIVMLNRVASNSAKSAASPKT